ncbi:MAG: ABC transporter ATP-binding protein [Gammaproteobacteria bacterium]|nr:ABC transporter ATP-binding protein [Gammaproteobacteria bacterium]
MSDMLLEVKNLQTWFDTREGKVRVVDDLSFSIRKGQTFCLLGESGCGKSMTALSIMQLLPSQASRNIRGEIVLHGRNLLSMSEIEMRAIRGNRVAMIFQEPMSSLNPVLRVGTQIGEVLKRHKKLTGIRARQRIIELLESVGIPEPIQRIDEYPHQLSGGMKQRVMIAIALAGEPDLLIADEPTTALDVTIQAQVLDLIKDLQKKNDMAVMMITHDLGVVAKMADEVAVMYAGQIVEQAPSKSFFKHPEHPYSQKLFDALPDMAKRDQSLAVIPGSVPSLNQEFNSCRFEPRCNRSWNLCKTQIPLWMAHTPIRGVRCHLYSSKEGKQQQSSTQFESFDEVQRSNVDAGQALLDVSNVKVHFPILKGVLKRVAGYVYAVDGVSLSLPKGRTVALVGESGCGKTTVGKAILQLIRPTAGKVLFENADLTRLSGSQLRRRRSEFQIIFQDPFSSMNPRMMVGDIIEEGMIAQSIGNASSERQQRVDELLTQVGLSPEHRQRYPHEFSGGQRQRICIARALAVNPKLIVCDEPTSALDVSVQAQILNLLKELQNKHNISYLFITHNISVVAYLADEVAVMYLGRIVEQGKVDEVLENPLHPYTKALLSAVPAVDKESKREIIRLEGDPPSPINPPAGCHFSPRCKEAKDICRLEYPETSSVGKTHIVCCHLYAK